METRPGWHIRLRARLRARVRARARWFGFGLHEPEHERGDHRKDPGGLGVHDARDTLCPKPAQRALRSGAPQQCQLDLTACDRRGTRRVFRARRCGAVRSCWAIAARDGPPPKARTSLHRLRMWPELPRHPWHSGTRLLGPSCDQHDAPPSVEPVCHRNGPPRRPRALGRHESATDRSSRARARAAGMF